jgi:hypothetical protein
VDGRQFDKLSQVVGRVATASPRAPIVSRRLFVGLASGILGAALDGSASASRNKRKKQKKKSSSGCGRGCPPCQRCVRGRCVADPNRDTIICGIGDCRSCQSGQCSVPEDVRCPTGFRCQAETGDCCPVCQAESCCPAGDACIDPPAGERYCCNTASSTPCARNDDGTYGDCCSNATEKCCEALNTCIPKTECCPGEPGCCTSAQEKCGVACCDRRTERCFLNQCWETCSLNQTYNSPCDDGVNHWCCHPDFATCCYDGGGDPHCCPT